MYSGFTVLIYSVNREIDRQSERSSETISCALFKILSMLLIFVLRKLFNENNKHTHNSANESLPAGPARVRAFSLPPVRQRPGTGRDQDRCGDKKHMGRGEEPF